MIFPFKKTYSDAEYVYGVKNGNSKIQNSFYEHCKDYFDQKYKKLFFTDDDKKMTSLRMRLSLYGKRLNVVKFMFSTDIL